MPPAATIAPSGWRASSSIRPGVVGPNEVNTVPPDPKLGSRKPVGW
jgi:hypothetical protein